MESRWGTLGGRAWEGTGRQERRKDGEYRLGKCERTGSSRGVTEQHDPVLCTREPHPRDTVFFTSPQQVFMWGRAGVKPVEGSLGGAARGRVHAAQIKAGSLVCCKDVSML